MDSRLRGNDIKGAGMTRKSGNYKKERDCHVGRNSGFLAPRNDIFIASTCKIDTDSVMI